MFDVEAKANAVQVESVTFGHAQDPVNWEVWTCDGTYLDKVNKARWTKRASGVASSRGLHEAVLEPPLEVQAGSRAGVYLCGLDGSSCIDFNQEEDGVTAEDEAVVLRQGAAVGEEFNQIGAGTYELTGSISYSTVVEGEEEEEEEELEELGEAGAWPLAASLALVAAVNGRSASGNDWIRPEFKGNLSLATHPAVPMPVPADAGAAEDPAAAAAARAGSPLPPSPLPHAYSAAVHGAADRITAHAQAMAAMVKAAPFLVGLSPQAQKRHVKKHFLALCCLNRLVERDLFPASCGAAGGGGDDDDEGGGVLERFGGALRSPHAAELGRLLKRCTPLLFSSVKMGPWVAALAASAGQRGSSGSIVLNFNRKKARRLVEKGGGDPEGVISMFGTASRQAAAVREGGFARALSAAQGGQPFKVTFAGERTIDAGGPYRESIDDLCMELEDGCPEDRNRPTLPVLVRSPNMQDSASAGCSFLLHPLLAGSGGAGAGGGQAAASTFAAGAAGSSAGSALGEDGLSVGQRTQQRMLHFLGQLMGLALRSNTVLPLNLAPLTWKQLVQAELGPDDLRAVDLGICKALGCMLDPAVTEEDFAEQRLDRFTFTTNVGGQWVEVVPGGAAIAVTHANRRAYADAVRRYRLHQADGAARLVREGLGTVVPLHLLSLWSGPELEHAIAGDPVIDIARLRAHAKYESPLSASSREVQLLFDLLEECTPRQRSLFLKFVWGRSRLPLSESQSAWGHPFKISRHGADNPDKAFPVAHTCFFQLELPAYTTIEAARDRVVYAMENCREMDGDGSYASSSEVQNADRELNVWDD
jgi:hypothetical protein